MKSNRLLFIGRLSFGNTPCAGEVIKNMLFCDRLSELYGNNAKTFDIMPYSRRLFLPFMFFKLLIRLFVGRYNKIIVSTHDYAALSIINFLGRWVKCSKIFYWVIGGGVASKIASGEIHSKYYKALAKIIVEDVDIESLLNKMGYHNVMTLPNFKPFVPIDNNPNKVSNKFVFVSRITPLKGCDIILSAVRKLNKKNLSFTVDFYGFIENNYPFEEYIENIPNVSYKGVISLKTKTDYEKLNQYSALVLPTYYPNEGFPGTMIDGFIAGLPIISTNWRYNSHILDNNETGWLIPTHDSDELAIVMEKIINGEYDLESMKEKCFLAAHRYDTKCVLSVDFFMKQNLL